MRNNILAALLLLALAALVCDLLVRIRPVQAQSPLTVYVERVPHHFKASHDDVVLKGSAVIGFHCADGSCFILSK